MELNILIFRRAIMGMPQIPEGTYRPSLGETVIDLLESIALEEMALAHIINAEGEKLQEIVTRYECNDLCYLQLKDGCQDSHSMINSLIMKEWLLLTKLKVVMDIDLEPPAPPQTQMPSRCHK